MLLNKPFPSSTLSWMEVQERILNNIKKFVTITRQHSKLEDISGQKIFEDLSLYDSEYNALWKSLIQSKGKDINTWKKIKLYRVEYPALVDDIRAFSS